MAQYSILDTSEKNYNLNHDEKYINVNIWIKMKKVEIMSKSKIGKIQVFKLIRC